MPFANYDDFDDCVAQNQDKSNPESYCGAIQARAKEKSSLPEEARTPPEKAQDNAKEALKARDNTGNPNDCGTDVGWARANQLANGEVLSEDTIERMAQFNRHRQFSEQSQEEGRTDCGWMMWQAWGGDAGIDWAIEMSEEMDKMKAEAIVKTVHDLDEKTDGGLSQEEVDTVLSVLEGQLNVDLTDEQL